MALRRVKQTIKTFLNCVGKLVCPKDKDTIFQGSTSNGTRQAALLRHVQPELRDVPLALQRNDVNYLTNLSYLPKFH
jgi:hypothetical protein